MGSAATVHPFPSSSKPRPILTAHEAADSIDAVYKVWLQSGEEEGGGIAVFHRTFSLVLLAARQIPLLEGKAERFRLQLVAIAEEMPASGDEETYGMMKKHLGEKIGLLKKALADS